LYHFYFRFEDGRTYNGVLTMASVHKNWYYIARAAYSTQARGEGVRKKETKCKTEKRNVVVVL